MSYSLWVEGTYEEIATKVVEAGDNYEYLEQLRKQGEGAMADAVEDHIGLATKVACEIIESQSVVKPDQLVRVSISGHANPNHEPYGGWADDALTIAVSQLRPEYRSNT